MVGTEPRVDHRRVVNGGGQERLGWVGILVNSGFGKGFWKVKSVKRISRHGQQQHFPATVVKSGAKGFQPSVNSQGEAIFARSHRGDSDQVGGVKLVKRARSHHPHFKANFVQHHQLSRNCR